MSKLPCFEKVLKTAWKPIVLSKTLNDSSCLYCFWHCRDERKLYQRNNNENSSEKGRERVETDQQLSLFRLNYDNWRTEEDQKSSYRRLERNLIINVVPIGLKKERRKNLISNLAHWCRNIRVEERRRIKSLAIETLRETQLSAWGLLSDDVKLVQQIPLAIASGILGL